MDDIAGSRKTPALGAGTGPVATRDARSGSLRAARVNGAVAGLRRLDVLPVEDSPVLAARLRELLEDLAFVGSLRVCDGESTARLASATADVVVLDLHLRDGSGFGLLRHLQQAARRPVVLVCTNHDVPGYRRRALELGADHFLDKARDLSLLPALLARVASGRRRTAVGDADLQVV